jgi:hypothetical protein
MTDGPRGREYTDEGDGSMRFVTKPRPTRSSPVSGASPAPFTPTGFTSQNGRLAVVDHLVRAFTHTAGTVTNVNQTLTTAVQSGTTAGSCDILNLVLARCTLTRPGSDRLPRPRCVNEVSPPDRDSSR